MIGFKSIKVMLNMKFLQIIRDSFLRIIVIILLSVWLILVLLNKSGFVHILLLNGIAIAVIDFACVYRLRAKE